MTFAAQSALSPYQEDSFFILPDLLIPRSMATPLMDNKQEKLVVNQETGESMMRIQLLEQGTPFHLILNKY